MATTSRIPPRKPPVSPFQPSAPNAQRPATGAPRPATPANRPAGVQPKTAKTVRRVVRRPQRPRSGGIPPWAWWIIGVIVLGLVSLGIRLASKSSDDGKIKGEMLELVQRAPGYKANSSYYQELVERCHSEAFEAAYTLGGRHQGNKFDDRQYLSIITEKMAKLAKREGHDDLALELALIHANFAGP